MVVAVIEMMVIVIMIMVLVMGILVEIMKVMSGAACVRGDGSDSVIIVI